MKITKVAAIMLAMSLMGSLFASGKKDGQKEVQLGTLSYLNFSEEQTGRMYDSAHLAYKQLEEKGYLKVARKGKVKISPSVKFYDTLDSLLMALKSGEIWGIAGLPQSTASYLCAKDNTLGMDMTYDIPKQTAERRSFAYRAYKIMNDAFSFMMLEKNSDLCAQFNKVIEEMNQDGSMKKLIGEQILDAMDGRELQVIQPENKAGRATIKVAVTGALPPMDYVAADGTFAGFNTALLSEIGKRLDKNITMVQVSSIGRATALASGTVDVVFWTRSSSLPPSLAKMTAAEFKAFQKEVMAKDTPEAKAALEALTSYAGKDDDPRSIKAHRDTPAGTITTVSYFEDMPVIVGLKN